MYIARRMAQLSGMGGMQWATDITKAIQDGGNMTSLWAGGPGSPVNTVAWSTMVDSFAAYTEFSEGLAGNAAFMELAAHGADHIDSFEPDVLLQVVHGELTGQAPIGSYLAAINAIINPAKEGEAVFVEKVRYRTVGDATLTAAVRSHADTIDKVLEEIAATRITERGATRGDDKVTEAAMEDRKREGYF